MGVVGLKDVLNSGSSMLEFNYRTILKGLVLNVFSVYCCLIS